MGRRGALALSSVGVFFCIGLSCFLRLSRCSLLSPQPRHPAEGVGEGLRFPLRFGRAALALRLGCPDWTALASSRKAARFGGKGIRQSETDFPAQNSNAARLRPPLCGVFKFLPRNPEANSQNRRDAPDVCTPGLKKAALSAARRAEEATLRLFLWGVGTLQPLLRTKLWRQRPVLHAAATSLR